MTAAMIQCSPKIKGSASESLLRDLEIYLPDGMARAPIQLHKPGVDGEQLAQLAACDIWVFAFGLYVDGVPAHLLRALMVLDRFFSRCPHRDITVYALVNCGFYEGQQARCALEIMRNWCERTGFRWGQGIGVGAGGMITALAKIPPGKGAKRDIGTAMAAMGGHITRRSLASIPAAKDLFVTANVPRMAYRLAAEFGWRQAIRANGLKREDLFIRK